MTDPNTIRLWQRVTYTGPAMPSADAGDNDPLQPGTSGMVTQWFRSGKACFQRQSDGRSWLVSTDDVEKVA